MITITQLLQILFNIFFGTNLYIVLVIFLFRVKYKEMYLPYFIIIESLFYALLLEKLNYDFRIIFTVHSFTPLQVVSAYFRHPQIIAAFCAVPVHKARLSKALIPQIYVSALVRAVRPTVMVRAKPDC